MIARLARWIDDRLGAADAAEEGVSKVFPEHWTFLFGEVALYSFVVLLVTGTFMALFFEPSLAETTYEGSYPPLAGERVSAAYASTVEMSLDTKAGLLIRQTHHWAALVFVAAMVVHMARIFFTGAFKRPREVNWLIGVTLLLLGIVNGFSGYSLPDDLLSGTGLRVAYSFIKSIPVVGVEAAAWLFGGEFPGEVVIHRLFVTHVWVVPAIMLGLVAAHLGLVVRQHHTQFPGPGKTEDNVVGQRLWPTFASKSVGLLFLTAGVLTLMGGLLQINPIWQYGHYDPAAITAGVQPDWYMGWVEGALRLFPSWEPAALGYEIPNVFVPAVLLPGLTFVGLYLWPWIDDYFTGQSAREHHLLERPRDHPIRTAVGVGVFTFYSVLFVAGSNDIIAAITRVPVLTITNLLRVLTVVLPVVAFAATLVVCRQLQEADRHNERKGRLRGAARAADS